jgi:carboxymethylenebutenolidase
MCDEQQLARMGKGQHPNGWLDRRRFGAVGALAGIGAALAACATVEGGAAAGLTEQMVSFPAAGGTMDAFFVHPAQGRHPAVIVWPDIAGIRDSFRMMARRLAAEGYAVLVLNPYYRDAPAPQFSSFADWLEKGALAAVEPWRAKLGAEAVMATARDTVAWLDAQPAVDSSAGIGTQGYCMGGPFTVWTAAAVPGRVRAVASFHGGGLVQEGEPTSPHALLDDTQAQFLFAIARDDDAKEPGHKDVLREAAAAAGRPAEIEVYDGDHGWTVPDTPAYDRAAAERAWGRLLALYERAL